MKIVLDFLNQLAENNNKEWFDANKSFYKEVKQTFEAFTEKLIINISEFDPTIRNLTVKDCTYRIYRDLRFSKDKTPYKTHIGAYICPNGKKSGLGGYYFHLESNSKQYLSSHLLATGTVCIPNNILNSIREDVFTLSNEFQNCINVAKDWELDTENKMKTMPKQFPKEAVNAEYLKLKDFILSKKLDDSYVLSDNLLERVTQEFEKTMKFKEFINRAIQTVD
ncbi:MAG: DUF2461 domain-containing protein [Bacteroidales bacterium]|nr:DUF2461 domain-containing protein [Bacteroidales bacterium]